MKEEHPRLQIRIYRLDGFTQTITQNGPDLVNRTLKELDPHQLFTQERITIANGDSQTVFPPPLLTRIDLVTHCLSAWDFPFALGVLVVFTEAQFMEGFDDLTRREQPRSRSEIPGILDLVMLDGQHLLLRMQVVDGLPIAPLGRIYSLLKERRLVFGLRTGGIGILNLANLWHFSVHSEPPEAATVAGSAHCKIGEQIRSLPENRTRYRSINRKARRRPASHNNRIVFDLPDET